MMPVATAQAVMLAVCASSLCISVGAAIAALREPRLSWKPVWAILALVGTGGAVIIWSAPGEVYWFFGVALPTASYAAVEGSWQPAMVRCLFPLGAVIVLARISLHRRRVRFPRVAGP